MHLNALFQVKKKGKLSSLGSLFRKKEKAKLQKDLARAGMHDIQMASALSSGQQASRLRLAKKSHENMLLYSVS